MISAAASIVGRVLTGATAGAVVEAIGFVNFYLLTTFVALPGVMLLLSTDPTDLADRLARTLRLPVRIVLAALVGLRLVTVMIDQWQVLVTARRARGVGGSRRPAAVLGEAGGRAFGLLVQALRRAVTSTCH